jgi:hypothetical protein
LPWYIPFQWSMKNRYSIQYIDFAMNRNILWTKGRLFCKKRVKKIYHKKWNAEAENAFRPISTTDLGVDVMITNFCDFCKFLAKILAFFSKPMLQSNFNKKLAVVWTENANIFANFFVESILKIKTSVPGRWRFSETLGRMFLLSLIWQRSQKLIE